MRAYDGKGIWKAPYLIDDPDGTKKWQNFKEPVTLWIRVKEILDVFDERGLRCTIFVITTDHGIDFQGQKELCSIL